MKGKFMYPYIKYQNYLVNQIHKNPFQDQQLLLQHLVKQGARTQYGRDHQLAANMNYDSFKAHVPIVDYEGGRLYFDQIKEGKPDITWPGKPKYFAKTSGTTSGVKYIPITPDSLPNHISTARLAIMNYASYGSNNRMFDGKLMFLSGSPTLSDTAGVMTGRLSGIVNHEIPSIIKGNQLPSYQTNCIEEWEQKVDQIILETHNQDLRLISGIPPWVQMYFERLLKYTGKSSVKEVFPNLQLFAYGGVNYEPYRTSIESLIGGRIDSLETYPASEGFIAFQDQIDSDGGLLLNTNSGIFFEFVELSSFYSDNPKRVMLSEVELNTDYVVIINSNAGLWGYNIGDTVRFVSLNPYRIVVSGRVKHFISAFGEHVIAKEVELALQDAISGDGTSVKEFTVAPQVNPSDSEKPYHEWFIEFDQHPSDLHAMATKLNESLCKQNIYYDDLITGAILAPLIIRPLRRDAFRTLMKERGKLGGQNKVPRLSNDRKIADEFDQLGLLKE
jgi:hypothetical protein